MNESTAGVFALSALVTLVASGIAQVPAGSEPAAVKEVQLLALRPFLATKIVRSEPLAAKPEGEAGAPQAVPQGVTHDYQVAMLRDVVFDQDGVIQAFVVEAVPPEGGKPATAKEPHVLLPREVHWRPEGMVLVTELDAAQIGALPPYESPKKVPPEGPPSSKPRTIYLASALLEAMPSRGVKSDKNERIGIRAPTIWLAPAVQRLAVVTIPLKEDDHRLAPFAAVHMTSSGDQVVLDLGEAATKVPDAPRIRDANTAPSSAERAACSKHFGVATPAWDGRSGSDAGSTAKK